jgi:hypothetical protein
MDLEAAYDAVTQHLEYSLSLSRESDALSQHQEFRNKLSLIIATILRYYNIPSVPWELTL